MRHLLKTAAALALFGAASAPTARAQPALPSGVPAQNATGAAGSAGTDRFNNGGQIGAGAGNAGRFGGGAGMNAAPMGHMGPVVGSHQIDRYDAIAKLQQSLNGNPRSTADWVILGEIAHEVATDAPADQAGKYFAMSSDAYKKALAIDPDNAGLKAAVQFANDQAQNADAFEKSRDAMTDTFLDARRRDLAATNNMPTVQTYGMPNARPTLSRPGTGMTPSATTSTNATPADASPLNPNAPGVNPNDKEINSSAPLNAGRDTPNPQAAPSVTPARENAPSTAAANYGTQQDYSVAGRNAPTVYTGAVYQPFVGPNGSPFTYQQYNNSYYPTGAYIDPQAAPMSLQRFTPSLTPNNFERQILNRANPRLPR